MRYIVLTAVAFVALATTAWAEVEDVPDQGTVTLVQMLLEDLGYDPGPADGVVGPSTKAAIIAYQDTAGKPATGKVSEELVTQLLDSALAERFPDLDSLDEDALAQEVPSERERLNEAMLERLRSTGALGGQ